MSEIPFRMYTSEVLALARFSASELIKRRKERQFPAPIDRGREKIYDGYAVYKALGIIKDEKTEQDPWMEALNDDPHHKAT